MHTQMPIAGAVGPGPASGEKRVSDLRAPDDRIRLQSLPELTIPMPR
jgi:hypothetical protein